MFLPKTCFQPYNHSRDSSLSLCLFPSLPTDPRTRQNNPALVPSMPDGSSPFPNFLAYLPRDHISSLATDAFHRMESMTPKRSPMSLFLGYFRSVKAMTLFCPVWQVQSFSNLLRSLLLPQYLNHLQSLWAVTRFTMAQIEKVEVWRSGTHRYTQTSDATANRITFHASLVPSLSVHRTSYCSCFFITTVSSTQRSALTEI